MRNKILAMLTAVCLVFSGTIGVCAEEVNEITNEGVVTSTVDAVEQSTFSVRVSKRFALSNQEPVKEYTVSAYGNISPLKKLVCEPVDAVDTIDGVNIKLTESSILANSVIVNVIQPKTWFASSELGYDNDGNFKEVSTNGRLELAEKLLVGEYTGSLEWNIRLEDDDSVADNDSANSNQCYVVLIDDDGTTACTSSGLVEYCSSKGVPITFAVPTSYVGMDGHYTLEELKNLESAGNEIVCHGYDATGTADDYTNGKLEEHLLASKEWMSTNGFNSEIYVYPDGNYSSDWEACRSTVGNHFTYALTCNVSSAQHLPQYDDEYTLTRGFWNTSNSDKLNIARSEILIQKTADNWYKEVLDDFVNNGGCLVLFAHSFTEEFKTGGGFENAKSIIEYLKTQPNVEFVKLSEALNNTYN